VVPKTLTSILFPEKKEEIMEDSEYPFTIVLCLVAVCLAMMCLKCATRDAQVLAKVI
jgi:hypothetical protein